MRAARTAARCRRQSSAGCGLTPGPARPRSARRSPATLVTGHTGGVVFARTVGLGELLVLVVIVGAVAMVGLVAFRNRTDGDA